MRPFSTVNLNRHAPIYGEADERTHLEIHLNKLCYQIAGYRFASVKVVIRKYCLLLRTRRKASGNAALPFLGYNRKCAVKRLVGMRSGRGWIRKWARRGLLIRVFKVYAHFRGVASAFVPVSGVSHGKRDRFVTV